MKTEEVDYYIRGLHGKCYLNLPFDLIKHSSIIKTKDA